MKPANLSIALTGGIGSGKSEAAAIITKIGIPVISADAIGHQVLKDHNIIHNLISAFGNHIAPQGRISRPLLAKTVFNDHHKTAILNQIMHPAIIASLKQRIANQSASITFYEVPLLFEANLQNLFDIIVMVFADENVREKRVLSRNGLSAQEFHDRASRQYDQRAAQKKADFVIVNNSDLLQLEDQVMQLLAVLKKEVM